MPLSGTSTSTGMLACLHRRALALPARTLVHSRAKQAKPARFGRGVRELTGGKEPAVLKFFTWNWCIQNDQCYWAESDDTLPPWQNGVICWYRRSLLLTAFFTVNASVTPRYSHNGVNKNAAMCDTAWPIDIAKIYIAIWNFGYRPYQVMSLYRQKEYKSDSLPVHLDWSSQASKGQLYTARKSVIKVVGGAIALWSKRCMRAVEKNALIKTCEE